MTVSGGTFLSSGHQRCVVRVDATNRMEEMSSRTRNVSCPPMVSGMVEAVELEACNSGLSLLQAELRRVLKKQ